MYRALKNTQVEIAETLMKFADEITKPVSGPQTSDKTLLEAIENMQKRQEAYFGSLLGAIERLNATIAKHVAVPTTVISAA